MGIKMSQKNPPVVYDGYVKYEEAEIHRSANMQDFRDSEKNLADWQVFWIFSCESCHGLSLCETLHFVVYSWSSHFAFLESSKYYKLFHPKSLSGH